MLTINVYFSAHSDGNEIAIAHAGNARTWTYCQATLSARDDAESVARQLLREVGREDAETVPLQLRRAPAGSPAWFVVREV